MTDQPDYVVPGTTVTHGDLLMLGMYLLNNAAAAAAMGHVSLIHSTMYIDYGDNPMSQVLRDIVWGAGYEGKYDENVQAARDRLEKFLWESGWMHRCAAAASEIDPDG